MAILVVCRNCMSRFSVSEKFAGRKGPCPKCKQIIEIPKLEDQVKVHAPEHSEAGARGASGQLVLKPVARAKADVPLAVWIGVGIAALVLLIVAVTVRVTTDSPPVVLLWIGAIALAPPCAAGSYFFLRDEELGGYTGKELWLRASICGAVHALCWLAFSFIPGDFKSEIYQWFFFAPPLIAIGGAASYFALDLDYFSGVMNFCFYLVVTAILALIMGVPLAGSGAPPSVDPRLQMQFDALPAAGRGVSLARNHLTDRTDQGETEHENDSTARRATARVLRRTAVQRSGASRDACHCPRIAAGRLRDVRAA